MRFKITLLKREIKFQVQKELIMLKGMVVILQLLFIDIEDHIHILELHQESPINLQVSLFNKKNDRIWKKIIDSSTFVFIQLESNIYNLNFSYFKN